MKFLSSFFVLVMLALCSMPSYASNEVQPIEKQKVVSFIERLSLSAEDECAVTLSLTVSVGGVVTGTATCTSTQPTCAQAISEAASCIKLAFEKIKDSY